MSDYAEVLLTQGKKAIIDVSDYALVSAFSWHATKSIIGTFYATTAIKKADGKWTTLYMHRLITGAPKGKEVDHLNHDTLDNRRANLRVGSHKDNMANGKWSLKTHCPRGHAYDESNTYINKAGKRICRACNALRVKGVYANETLEKREKRRERAKNDHLKNRQERLAQMVRYAAGRKAEKAEYDRERRKRLKA